MLVKKESIIEGGIRMFDEEEQMLDIALAKYRYVHAVISRHVFQISILIFFREKVKIQSIKSRARRSRRTGAEVHGASQST